VRAQSACRKIPGHSSPCCHRDGETESRSPVLAAEQIRGRIECVVVERNFPLVVALWMEAKLGLSPDAHPFAEEVHFAAFEVKEFAWAQSGVTAEHDVLREKSEGEPQGEMGEALHFLRTSKHLFIFVKGEVANPGLAVIGEVGHLVSRIDRQESPLHHLSAELP